MRGRQEVQEAAELYARRRYRYDRTILSGIHAYYEPEDLVGKTLLAITNLLRAR